MPKWWPWGRSSRAAPDPWQRPLGGASLAPASGHQRTVGEIEPTARWDFNASLTTAQNPALTGQLEGCSPRSTPNSCPCWTRCATRSARPLTNRTVPPRRPSNTKWSRSCRSRNALVGSVPRRPARRGCHRRRGSFTRSRPQSRRAATRFVDCSPQPLDQRILDVATDDSSSDGAWSQESLPSSPTAEESYAVPDTADMDSASTTAAVAPVPSLFNPCQRCHRTAPASASRPLRRLPSVQRPVTGNDRAPNTSPTLPLPLCEPQIHQAVNGATTRRMRGPHRPAAANRHAADTDVGPDRAVETAITPPLPSRRHHRTYWKSCSCCPLSAREHQQRRNNP